MALSVGDRLGRYEILGLLGAGGMGEIWKARDTELVREVAVKVLPDEVALDTTRIERFRREAKALAALSHPNLLEIHDVGSADGVSFVVTELLEGESLRAAIPPSGLPWRKVSELGADIAEGLAAANEVGIVHRDLKPENLFLTADGRVKILDFGLATIDDEEEPDGESPTVTEAGTVLGTVGYAAPEQLEGHRADVRSDIFSLGCVLYEMVTGRRAFSGDSRVAVMAAILKEHPPQLSSTGAAVPVDLERVVHRCLEKHPEARFQSAADLAYSLRRIGTGAAAPVMATPKPARRTRLWQMAIAAALVMVAAVIAWRALTPDREQTPAVTDLDPNRIAVVPFANRTDDAELDQLGARVVDRITQQLAELEDLQVVPPRRIAAALTANPAAATDPRRLVDEVVTATSAGLVLTGVMDPSGQGIELLATLEDTIDGRVLRAFEPLTTDPSDATNAIATLADWSTIATNDHLHPSLAFGAGRNLPTMETYRRFSREFKLFDRTRANEFFSLLEEEPTFTRLRLMLALAVLDNGKTRTASHLLDTGYYDDADVNQHQAAVVLGLRNWIAAEWELAYRMFRDELQKYPGNVTLRHAAMRCALRANRPTAVIDMHEDLEYDTAVPAAAYVFVATDAAHAHHLMGQHVEELRVLERLRTDLPSSELTDWGLMRHAVALGALGDPDEIDALLNRNSRELGPCASTQARVGAARELRTHGQTEAAIAVIQPLLAGLQPGTEEPMGAGCSWWNEAAAEALLIAGRDQEAAELCRGFSIEVEGWRAALLFPGIAAARLGEAENARIRAADLAALGRAELADGTARPAAFTLGRAMIFAQLGDEDRAMELVRRAVAEGLPVHDLHCNPFLEPLWDNPEFQEILRPRG